MASPANRRTAPPLILAIVFLLLPLLYVGSFLVLVVPPGAYRRPPGPEFWQFNSFGCQPSGALRLKKLRTRDVAAAELINQDFGGEGDVIYDYRWGGHNAAWFFWPLEQLDRRVRPAP